MENTLLLSFNTAQCFSEYGIEHFKFIVSEQVQGNPDSSWETSILTFYFSNWIHPVLSYLYPADTLYCNLFSYTTLNAQQICQVQLESLTENRGYIRFSLNLDSGMIWLLANYTPDFSSFHYIPHQESFGKLAN